MTPNAQSLRTATLAYARDAVEIYQGDVRTVLPLLAANSVDCIVTSPPYWGLRDYGTAEWEGGAAGCDHAERELRRGKGLAAWSEENARGGGKKAGEVGSVPYRDQCRKCGAVRIDRQIGMEHTVPLYLRTMVRVFRDLRRVLKPTGTLWLNMGDSYATSTGPNGGYQGSSGQRANRRFTCETKRGARVPAGLKPKDMVLMPARLALALQADGWWVRSEIIWAKPNPMPESVSDRPTKSHEVIYLLTKSARYFYDQEATLEAVSDNTHARLSQDLERQIGSARADGGTRAERPMKAVGRQQFPTGWATGPGHHGDASSHNTPEGRAARTAALNVRSLGDKGETRGEDDRAAASARMGRGAGWRKALGGVVGVEKQNPSFEESVCLRVTHRNMRDVWTMPTEAYREAHFAVFPTELARRCIAAGCPAGGVVMDPFSGSGTVALVARALQRSFVGVELNPAYIALAAKRLRQPVLDFAQVAAPATPDAPASEPPDAPAAALELFS